MFSYFAYHRLDTGIHHRIQLTFDPPPVTVPMMVPVADILNHIADNNAKLQFDVDNLKMVATKKIKAVSDTTHTASRRFHFTSISLHVYFTLPYNFHIISIIIIIIYIIISCIIHFTYISHHIYFTSRLFHFTSISHHVYFTSRLFHITISFSYNFYFYYNRFYYYLYNYFLYNSYRFPVIDVQVFLNV